MEAPYRTSTDPSIPILSLPLSSCIPYLFHANTHFADLPHNPNSVAPRILKLRPQRHANPTSVQRITRYPLLLKQILHYTGQDQDFQSVQNALNETENIVSAINESVREAEGAERLRVLSEDLWIGGEG